MSIQEIKRNIDSIKILEKPLEEDSYSPIGILNDDCLIYIFDFLSIANRIRIERVSKRWQKVAKESWRQLKVLNLRPIYLGLKPFGTRHEFPTITEQVTEKILKKCGKYVEKINVYFHEVVEFFVLK